MEKEPFYNKSVFCVDFAKNSTLLYFMSLKLLITFRAVLRAKLIIFYLFVKWGRQSHGKTYLHTAPLLRLFGPVTKFFECVCVCLNTRCVLHSNNSKVSHSLMYTGYISQEFSAKPWSFISQTDLSACCTQRLVLSDSLQQPSVGFITHNGSVSWSAAVCIMFPQLIYKFLYCNQASQPCFSTSCWAERMINHLHLHHFNE